MYYQILSLFNFLKSSIFTMELKINLVLIYDRLFKQNILKLMMSIGQIYCQLMIHKDHADCCHKQKTPII